MSEVKILSQDDVKLCLPMNKAIQAVQEAYIAFAKGRVKMPPVMHLDVSQYNGEIDIKSGYIEDFGLIGTKIASGFYDNYKLGLPPRDCNHHLNGSQNKYSSCYYGWNICDSI